MCVIIFIWASVHFCSRLRELRDHIDSYISSDENNVNPKLMEGINGYFKTMGTNGYCVEYASDYISIDSLSLPYNIKLKVFSSIPNILTSLGILGTFLGLSVALLSFNSTDSEAIRTSIHSLLDGMSSAFWTSVAGMATSALFLFRERRRVNKTEQCIDHLCSFLDSKYHKSADQVLIDNFSQKLDDGITVSPAESFMQITTSLKSMDKSLGQIGTDLYDNIGNALDNSFHTKLAPILEDLSHKLENPAQTVSDSIVKELGEVCNSFKNNLTESVNKQMDELLERFIDASNAINNIPDVMSGINKAYKDSSNDTLRAQEEVSKALDEQVLRLVDLSDTFASALEKMAFSVEKIESVNNSLADMPHSVLEAAQAIGSASENLKESNSHVGETLSNIQSTNEKTTSAVRGYTENISTIQVGLKAIFADINEGLTKYADTTKSGLQKMLDPFTTSITDATAKVANSIAPLNDAVDELSTFGDTVTKSLKQLSEAIRPLDDSIKKLNSITRLIENK